MKTLSVHRKLSVLERCPYREVRLYWLCRGEKTRETEKLLEKALTDHTFINSV